MNTGTGRRTGGSIFTTVTGGRKQAPVPARFGPPGLTDAPAAASPRPAACAGKARRRCWATWRLRGLGGSHSGIQPCALHQRTPLDSGVILAPAALLGSIRDSPRVAAVSGRGRPDTTGSLTRPRDPPRSRRVARPAPGLSHGRHKQAPTGRGGGRGKGSAGLKPLRRRPATSRAAVSRRSLDGPGCIVRSESWRPVEGPG